MTVEHDEWVRTTLDADPAKYGQKPPAAPGGGALATAGGFAKGVAEGAADGVVDMVSGLWGVAKAAGHGAYALATDDHAREAAGSSIAHGAEAVAAFGEKVVTRPSEAADDVVNAAKTGVAIGGQIAHQVKAGYDAASKEGHGAEFVGKGVGQAAVLVGSLFIPGGGEAKAASLAADAGKAAEAASATVKAAEAAELAAKAAKAAKATELATDAGQAGHAGAAAASASAAGDAGKAAHATEAGKAADVVDAAKIEEAAAATKVAPRTGPPHPPKDFSKVRAKSPTEFDKASTFETKGVPDDVAKDFLTSPEGKEILKLAIKDPKAAAAQKARVLTWIKSGAEAPKVEELSTPLVKIVPAGKSVGPFSPFFSTPEHLNEAVQSGKNLAEFFGLPASSEAASYDVYMIVPKAAQKVMVNSVAPTAEFGGEIERAGGAVQHLVVDRSAWSAPKLIGHVTN